MKVFAVCCILLIGLVAIQPLVAAIGCRGKQSWPELVGVKGKKAAEIIEKENKFVKAELIPPAPGLTFDFRCDRVRVFLDKLGGVVIKTPVVT